MGAAVLQGVPVVTQDIDFWIGRPLNRHDVRAKAFNPR